MSDVEEESSMVKSKSIWEQVSIRDNGEYVIEKSYTAEKKKMNKKKQQKKKITLPEEIIFDILVRVPVKLLHKKFRFVCKQWNTIISSPFLIDQSMLHSKPIYILHERKFCKSRILDIKDDELGWSCHPNPQYCHIMNRRRIRGSCNGLLLVSLQYRDGQLRVNNPITKQVVTLPRCPSGCPHWLCHCACGIGFVPSTGEYKVVHLYKDLSFEIFTLGDDPAGNSTWRKLPGPFRDRQERPFDEDYGWLDAVLVNKSMLHWNVESQEHIISMDVSNEKLCKVNLPNPGRIDGGKFESDAMLDLGGFLSVFYSSRTAMDVWILKDLEKQVWIKQHSIISEHISYLKPTARRVPDLDKFLPIAIDATAIFYQYMDNGSNTGLYKYDMESRKLTRFKMRLKLRKLLTPILHVNTLIRFKALAVSDAKFESPDLKKELEEAPDVISCIDEHE